MLCKTGSSVQKVWARFSKTGKLGMKHFRLEKLKEERFEDFLDFKMEYYVELEKTFVVAGMHKNPKAQDEYRQLFSKSLRDPSYEIAICRLDDEEHHDIIGFSALKLYKKGDVYQDTKKVITKELKNYYKILHEWNSLCPVPAVLDKYGVERFYEDAGAAVYSRYSGYRISEQISKIRILQCKEHGVEMTGAWMTSSATQVTAQRNGWETIYNISSEELGRKLGISFGDDPPYYKFMIMKI